MISKRDEQFMELLKSHATITGSFEINQGSNALMDLDLENVIFRDCSLLGGDFCSSIFRRCSFEHVVFKDLALVGVTFDQCKFIACKFINVQISFSMHKCDVDGLVITESS